jgi:hypothetical protein
MIGDVKFHGYSTIEADAADRWKDEIESDFLSDITWALAEEIGYERLTSHFKSHGNNGNGRSQTLAEKDASELLSQIDDLSDEEVEALLLQML